MRSRVDDFRRMGETRNTTPSTSTVVFGTNLEVWHWPIGVRTTIGGSIFSSVKLCATANASDMKECDAPESNKTVPGTEFTRRVPSRLILSFFSVDVVGMSTSTRGRPNIIVGGPRVATTMYEADRVNYQLILSLGAVSGNVSWLATLEA